MALAWAARLRPVRRSPPILGTSRPSTPLDAAYPRFMSISRKAVLSTLP